MRFTYDGDPQPLKDEFDLNLQRALTELQPGERLTCTGWFEVEDREGNVIRRLTVDFQSTIRVKRNG